MSQPLLSRAACLATAALLASGPGALAQTAPAASSWIEAGGAYHSVTNHFGDWKGGYIRAVLAGTRNTWYVDAKTQEAFRDAGSYGSVANVHTWSSRVYTQLGAGAGTGRYVLPDLRLDAAVSFKLGASRAVVFTAGGTVVKSKSVYQDKALFGSLTWYLAPAVVAEVGGRFNWSNPNAVRSERVNATLSHGRAGHALVTLRGSVGTEGYQLTGAGTTLRRFRSQEAGLIIRKWLGHSWGGVLGTEWYHNPFYARFGGSAGVFYAW